MKLLLLVHSEADVQHLSAAAQAVLNSAIKGVWIVFSPAITVNASEAASKLDAEIAQLKTAEQAAAGREDYEAAKGYKTQREGKVLDRAAALRDAWKTAPDEARKARVKEIFAPFMELSGINVKITGHSDHYDREQWVAMLNSLTGVWFKEFAPGGFVVGWPESVEASIKSVGYAPVAEPPSHPAPTAARQVASPKLPQTRREVLQATHHMSLRPMAKTLGIDVTGKGTAEIIELILAAEANPNPAPETADAY